MLQLTFNPGLMLTGFQTSRPWIKNLLVNNMNKYSADMLVHFAVSENIHAHPKKDHFKLCHSGGFQ